MAVGMRPRALAQTSAGILRTYHHAEQGENGQRGHSPPCAPSHNARLQRGILLHAGGDERVDACQRQRNGCAEGQRREVGGIEEALPELVIPDPASGGQHEGDDAVDDYQAEVGGNEVDPAVPQVQARFQLVPTVQIEECSGDLNEKENPFNRPAPNVGMDQVARSRGADQADGEPDAYPADGAEDHGNQHKEFGVLFKPAEEGCVVFAPGPVLGDHQKEPASDGEMRDKYVKDGDDGDEQTGAKCHIPNRIVHAAPPVPAFPRRDSGRRPFAAPHSK